MRVRVRVRLCAARLAEQACVAVSGVIQYCIRFGLLKYSCPLPQAAASWSKPDRTTLQSSFYLLSEELYGATPPAASLQSYPCDPFESCDFLIAIPLG
jgi:hypothetical protein